MRRSRRVWLLLACLLVGLAPARGADREAADRLAGPPPGGLTGKVLDPSGHGIEGARVTLKRGDSLRTALTDAGGEYCFCRVAPARDYTLEIEKEGFTGVMDKDTYVGKMRVTVRNVILEPLSGLPGAEPGRR